MVPQIVAYQLDDDSLVRFEIEPAAGFQPAGAGAVAGKVRDAIEPAIEAARIVLAKVRETRPDAVEVSFGVKVSGKLDWVIARAASEANFQVKLSWTAPPSAKEPAAAS